MFKYSGMFYALEESQYRSSSLNAIIERCENSDQRKRANKLFEKKLYPHALFAYNLALLNAHDDDAEKSLIYANRAACYLEMKFFKNCLNNLDLAEPHYPADKIKKLHERRETCLKLMAVERDEGQIKLEHPFDTLSYPANPKLPFFIDAIELKQDKVFGRHLITSQDLRAGDVIALIDQSLKFREILQRDWGCANCLTRGNNDVFASDKCEKALFCSQSCVDEYTKIDHKELLAFEESTYSFFEPHHRSQMSVMNYKVFMQILNSFDSIADMRKFVEKNEKEPKTVFDFDWSDVDGSKFLKNILCCILSAETIIVQHFGLNYNGFVNAFILDAEESPGGADNLEFIQFLKRNSAEHGAFMDEMMLRIFGALAYHQTLKISLLGQILDSGNFFHPCMLLLNHSCDPNIFSTIVDENKVAWIANRPIKAGQQIFINYNNATEFYFNYGYKNKCEYKETCVPCREDWRKTLDPKHLPDPDNEHFQPMAYKYDMLMEFRDDVIIGEIKSAMEFINDNFEGYKTDVKVREKIVKKYQAMQGILEVLNYPGIHMRKWIR